jgi:hypothetical protein
MASGLRGFDGPVLLVLSGDDYTAREFADWTTTSPAWQGLLGRGTVVRHDMATADHTFSDLADQEAQSRICLDWLKTRCLARTTP